MRAGVAVLFFKAGKQGAARRVTAAAQVHAVIAGLAQGTVYPGAQAHGGFGHADHQYRAGQVSRNLAGKGIEALCH